MSSEAPKFVLKKPCPDDVLLEDFLGAIGARLDKVDKCTELAAWLKDKCSAADIGILKDTCTAVKLKEGMKHVGLDDGFKLCVEKYLGFQFLISKDEQMLSAKSSTGGMKEKKWCKSLGTITQEIGLEGVADIKLRTKWFRSEVGKIDPRRSHLSQDKMTKIARKIFIFCMIKYRNVYGDDTLFEHLAIQCEKLFPYLRQSKRKMLDRGESDDEDETDVKAHWKRRLVNCFENVRSKVPATIVLPEVDLSEEVKEEMETGDLPRFKTSANVSSIYPKAFGENEELQFSDDEPEVGRKEVSAAPAAAPADETADLAAGDAAAAFSQETLDRHMRPGVIPDELLKQQQSQRAKVDEQENQSPNENKSGEFFQPNARMGAFNASSDAGKAAKLNRCRHTLSDVIETETDGAKTNSADVDGAQAKSNKRVMEHDSSDEDGAHSPVLVTKKKKSAPKKSKPVEKKRKATFMAATADRVILVGERVKAVYFDGKKALRGCSGYKNKTYNGIITAVQDENTFTVEYSDGSVESDVKRASIQVLV